MGCFQRFFLNYYKMRYSLVLVIFFVLNHIFLEKKKKQTKCVRFLCQFGFRAKWVRTFSSVVLTKRGFKTNIVDEEKEKDKVDFSSLLLVKPRKIWFCNYFVISLFVSNYFLNKVSFIICYICGVFHWLNTVPLWNWKILEYVSLSLPIVGEFIWFLLFIYFKNDF